MRKTKMLKSQINAFFYNCADKQFKTRYLSFFVILSVIVTALGRSGKTHIQAFKMAHFAFNYEIEFIKRGLIGELFRQLSIPITQSSIYIFSLLILIVFSYLIYNTFHSLFIKTKRQYLVSFSLLFLLSPATFLHIGYDFARFDYVNYTIMLVVLLGYLKNTKTIIYLSPVLLSLTLLIHEAAIFIVIPFIICVSIYFTFKKKNINKSIIFLQILFVTITLTALYFNGNADTIKKEVYEQIILKQINVTGETHGVVKILYRDIKDNVKDTLNLVNEIRTITLFVLVITVIYLFSYFYFKTRLKLNGFLISTAPIAVVFLFFLGIDYQRWASLMVTNLFFAFAFLIFINKDLSAEHENNINYKKLKLTYLILLFCFLIGPFKVIL